MLFLADLRVPFLTSRGRPKRSVNDNSNKDLEWKQKEGIKGNKGKGKYDKEAALDKERYLKEMEEYKRKKCKKIYILINYLKGSNVSQASKSGGCSPSNIM